MTDVFKNKKEKDKNMEWKELLSEKRIREFYKTTTGRDLRTEFEKDYHRIIGSASFRRLQDKTQVFPLDKSDYIRTRLTHSLEVSSFAKSLAQNVGEKLIKENKDKYFGARQKEDIGAILQCAGLIHDIGNPPFGHVGETCIQDWFKENLEQKTFFNEKITDILSSQMIEDFYHFEGNTQALRVVTKLHFLVDEHGMNLTEALLGTIIKYPCSSLESGKNKELLTCKKMGYFYADQETYQEIENTLHTEGKRHPLTFLLEAADDIAYKTADIEDAVKKGCITYQQLLNELEKEADNNNSLYQSVINILEHKYEKAIKAGYEEPDVYAVQNWVVSIQGNMLFAASDSFVTHYDEIMQGTYHHDLFYGTEAEKIMNMLGDIAYRYVFTTHPIYKLEIAAQTIFYFLMDHFTDAVIYYDTQKKLTAVQNKLVSLISQDYKRIYHTYSKGKDEAEKLYLRLLLVTDFICGMTDSYAKNLYQELNGIQ